MADNNSNPFTPVFGKVPAYLAGRESYEAEMLTALRSNGNDPSLVSLFVGARGTGKTALLSVCADMAEADGWIVARITAVPGMLDEILARLARSADHLLAAKPGKKLKGVGISAIGSVEWDNAPTTRTTWRTEMDKIFDQLSSTDTGLLVTVDEIDSSLDEMTTLVTAFQHFLDEGRKAALFMAGLPYGSSALLSGKTTSFLRRAVRHEIGPLENSDVELALRLTMEKGGKILKPKALEAAVDAIGGFPYMLQLLGYRAWALSGNRSTIGTDDIQAAISIAQRELEERVYEATLFELTNADKAFLAAMLEDEGPTRQANLPGRLNRKSGHVSKYKKRMLEQGIIRERARGMLEFCLPGFREYLAKTLVD